MSDHLSAAEQIQAIYNKTKNLKSPSDLDKMILGKIRTLEEEPAPPVTDNWWLYAPIAASILLMVLLQFQDDDNIDMTPQQPVEIVQSPDPKQEPLKLKEMQVQQLPQLFFQKTDDIKHKIVRACNGELVMPEENQSTAESNSSAENKPSKLPIRPIYPNDTRNKTPECDNVSNQIFKR